MKDRGSEEVGRSEFMKDRVGEGVGRSESTGNKSQVVTVWVQRGREKTLDLNLGMHAEKLQGEIGVERSSRFVYKCTCKMWCVPDVYATYSTQFSSPPLVAAHLADNK